MYMPHLEKLKINNNNKVRSFNSECLLNNELNGEWRIKGELIIKR